MLGKVGKSRVGAKSAGKSPFADLVNYVAREADGKGREVDKEEMGVLNLNADVEGSGSGHQANGHGRRQDRQKRQIQGRSCLPPDSVLAGRRQAHAEAGKGMRPVHLDGPGYGRMPGGLGHSPRYGQ